MDDQDHTPLFMTMNTKIIQMLDMGLELEKWNKIKRRPSNMSVPSKSTYGRIQNTIRPITSCYRALWKWKMEMVMKIKTRWVWMVGQETLKTGHK